MKETELYMPVKTLLTAAGYTVYGEVNGADVVAIKEESLLIVELKTSFNLKLLIQAAERQKLTDSVYVAIPRPKYKKSFGRDFREKENLLKRLGLGLIFVVPEADPPYAQIVFDPRPQPLYPNPKRYAKRIKSMKKELALRSGDYNIAGTNGKIMTAYREQSLALLKALSLESPKSPKELKEKTGNPKAGRLLIDNHYSWFDRISKGQYEVSQEGIKALEEYSDFLDGRFE